jgi:uncharacterized C2H2 Zn-finger protein
MESSALSCGKCGATFRYKRNLTKHALLGLCGKKRGPAAKSPRKSNRKAANGVHNLPIPISRFRVSSNCMFALTAQLSPCYDWLWWSVHLLYKFVHASCCNVIPIII